MVKVHSPLNSIDDGEKQVCLGKRKTRSKKSELKPIDTNDQVVLDLAQHSVEGCPKKGKSSNDGEVIINPIP